MWFSCRHHDAYRARVKDAPAASLTLGSSVEQTSWSNTARIRSQRTPEKSVQAFVPEGWPRIAQRLNVGCAGLEVHKSRQGRLNPCEIGQPSFQDLSRCGRGFPTFKRWAILECPSGTKAWTGFACIPWGQISLGSNPSGVRHSCPPPALAPTCGQKCPRSMPNAART